MDAYRDRDERDERDRTVVRDTEDIIAAGIGDSEASVGHDQRVGVGIDLAALGRIGVVGGLESGHVGHALGRPAGHDLHQPARVLQLFRHAFADGRVSTADRGATA